jgi:NAD(P)-dependent dehydrogenase (short-subunit alcohol dehydrogenase family)
MRLFHSSFVPIRELKMGFDVAGKTALVTGANRGIGRSIVERLLEAGAAKVYAAVRDPESARDLVESSEGRVVALPLDLTDDDSIAAAAETARDAELVVNNGGILKMANPLADDALDRLDEEMDVNVKGLIRIARAFAPVLASHGGGAFVQLNSVASLRCFADFATYSASKAAAYSITQGLQAMLAKDGTHVVSVHPGPIATDMANSAGFGDIAEPPRLVADQLVDALAAGDFHVFPDTMAKNIWRAYQGFAKAVVEETSGEGH